MNEFQLALKIDLFTRITQTLSDESVRFERSHAFPFETEIGFVKKGLKTLFDSTCKDESVYKVAGWGSKSWEKILYFFYLCEKLASVSLFIFFLFFFSSRVFPTILYCFFEIFPEILLLKLVQRFAGRGGEDI